MEEELLGKLQACLDHLNGGDQAAADELVTLALGRFRELASRLLRKHFRRLRGHETDSVINSAWPQLIQSIKNSPPATVRALLGLASQIIRHDLIDLARRESAPHRQALPLGTVNSEEAATTTLDPGELESWTQFHRAVSELPNPEREVFEMHYYQGLPQALIARLLQLPPRQVSRLYVAATGMLARRLRQGGFLG